MKKALILFSVAVLSLGLLQVPVRAESKFGFKVGGGLVYAGGGDFNTGLQGMTDIYAAVLRVLGYSSVTGSYTPFHLGMDFQGEFLFHVSPGVALGLGMGYLSMAQDSTLTATLGSTTAVLTWKPKVNAIPITFNFHFYLPAGNSFKFDLNTGLGYYLAKVDHTFDISSSGSSAPETYALSAGGFGFHGGVGLDVALSPAVSLVLDLLGRYATASGFTGSYTSGSTTMTNGKFYYYVFSSTIIGTFPALTYDVAAPSGTEISNVREAKLDLSGFSARLGFVFHF